MGILCPHLGDDINDLASELLRREDPEPLEVLAGAMFGGSEEPEVFVDGMRR